jgi:hypothetical protein
MLRKVLIAFAVLAVILVAFAGVVAMQPSGYRVERTATIAAPASAVFDQVNNFQNWEAWSPWAKMDPAAKNTFEGPSEGTGAIFRWAGNDDVGEGSMTILESRPSELIKIKLAFLKPMEGDCDTLFTFKPEGDQTVVTWTMSGKNNFIGKAMCMFMDMDEMVGGQFEQGLANIESVVKAAPEASSDATPSAGETPAAPIESSGA